MQSDIITMKDKEVQEMPHLPCSHCSKPFEINAGSQDRWNLPNTSSNPSRISGTAICRQCEAATGFEIIDNVQSYVEGKRGYGNLDPKVSQLAQDFFAEAEMCARSASPNAVAAMCRASIETMLNDRGFKDNNLKKQINLAAAEKALDEGEIALAHGSRLLANSAMHRGELLLAPHIPPMLVATVVVLNKLANLPSVQSPQ